MKSFINHYRNFRNCLFEECGDMEDENVLLLYSLYLEHKHTVVHPFGGLESFFKQFSSFVEPTDPDDESNDDDPFANTSGV
jgi:hypothetical protein